MSDAAAAGNMRPAPPRRFPVSSFLANPSPSRFNILQLTLSSIFSGVRFGIFGSRSLAVSFSLCPPARKPSLPLRTQPGACMLLEHPQTDGTAATRPAG